jgi:hypothetical protein
LPKAKQNEMGTGIIYFMEGVSVTMADSNDRKISPRRSGFFYDITNRARLIGRLMMDSRVNPFIKVLPVGSLLYLLFPDIPGPIDDALIMWLGTYLFVELCPPGVVQEHLKQLQGMIPGQWENPPGRTGPTQQDDIIDGEYYDSGIPRDPQNPNPRR